MAFASCPKSRRKEIKRAASIIIEERGKCGVRQRGCKVMEGEPETEHRVIG